ncbi:MAG: hypothetical protein K0S33_3727 [Bacteroidetes bacterium]|jgi:hypothetical protein|nr:hypothetical protein [Bacteroidota bacterium]
MQTEKIKPVGCELKAYTKKELRLLYGIPESTFKRWLKAVAETADTGRKNWLNLIQVEALFRKYGVPGVKVIEYNLPIPVNTTQ